MFEDLLSPGFGGSVEVTTFSKAGSSWQDGWIAASPVTWLARKTGAGCVTR